MTEEQRENDQTNQNHQDNENTSENDQGSRESQLLDQIAGLENDLGEAKDRFLRAHAEMENMRRRMEKERGDLLKYGLEGFYKDILPVLDSFEKALPSEPSAQMTQEMQAHYEGMLLLKNQLINVMQKHGLESIEAKNQPFDPNVHQAIQRVESGDADAETVGEEYARGYLLNGRLLRPAMVSVIVPKKSD